MTDNTCEDSLSSENKNDTANTDKITCSMGTCRKTPIISLASSLVFPGMGQLYNEQIHKGSVLVIAYAISLTLCFFIIIIGIPFALLIWAYSMYDAFSTAKAINRGEIVEDKFDLKMTGKK